MTRPTFSTGISLGNVLSALIPLLAAGIAWGDLQAKVETLAQRQEEDRAEIRENTKAIRSLEMSGAAIDQRLQGIERSTQRTERMLERLIQEQD